jgi:hypothetical protein
VKLVDGNDTFYKGSTFSSPFFSPWRQLAHVLNFDYLVGKKMMLLRPSLVTKYDLKWIGSTKWIDCHRTYPILVVSYTMPLCIMWLKVNKLGRKLNMSIFGCRLERGLTCWRCNQNFEFQL